MHGACRYGTAIAPCDQLSWESGKNQIFIQTRTTVMIAVISNTNPRPFPFPGDSWVVMEMGFKKYKIMRNDARSLERGRRAAPGKRDQMRSTLHQSQTEKSGSVCREAGERNTTPALNTGRMERREGTGSSRCMVVGAPAGRGITSAIRPSLDGWRSRAGPTAAASVLCTAKAE